MRTLLLLRHAKSSWDTPELDDHARPLNLRGVRAAQQMAVYLHEEGLQPNLVLCSSACRTQQTLDALRPVLGETVDVHIEDGLYGASSAEILRRLRLVEPAISSVMVIGHNPGLEDLAVELASDGAPAALTQLRTKFPTAALAILDAGRDTWARLSPGQAYLSEIVLPRHLSS